MEIKIDKLIRSKRKTLALEISQDGSLIVRAPEKASMEAINRFIAQKRFWIEDKQKIIRQRNEKPTSFLDIDGKNLLYLGENYHLDIIKNAKLPIEFREGFFLSESYIGNASEIIQAWYIRQAKLKINERVCKYSADFGFKYNKINITNARTRWGSCSSKANLSFCWRLIMAPPKIIDYVVIHELVHLKIKDHSQDFWRNVGSIFPDYRQCRDWLKQYGHTLVL